MQNANWKKRESENETESETEYLVTYLQHRMPIKMTPNKIISKGTVMISAKFNLSVNETETECRESESESLLFR